MVGLADLVWEEEEVVKEAACSLSFIKVRGCYEVDDIHGTHYGLILKGNKGVYVWDAFYCREEVTGKSLREILMKLDELNGFGCTDTTEYKLR